MNEANGLDASENDISEVVPGYTLERLALPVCDKGETDDKQNIEMIGEDDYVLFGSTVEGGPEKNRR